MYINQVQFINFNSIKPNNLKFVLYDLIRNNKSNT